MARALDAVRLLTPAAPPVARAIAAPVGVAQMRRRRGEARGGRVLVVRRGEVGVVVRAAREQQQQQSEGVDEDDGDNGDCEEEERVGEAVVEVFAEMGWNVVREDVVAKLRRDEVAPFLGGVAKKYGIRDFDTTMARKRFLQVYLNNKKRQVGLVMEDFSDQFGGFSGLGVSEAPVGICQTRTLDPVLALSDALPVLQIAVNELEKSAPSASGIIRIQVPLPPGIKALQWLQCQPQSLGSQRTYFSSRAPRGDKDQSPSSSPDVQDVDDCDFRAIAGIGAAVLFQDHRQFSKSHWSAIQRFLGTGAPEIKVFGAMRFNPQEEPSEEWKLFGSFYFLIPQVEFCEKEGCSMLAVSVAWDTALHRSFLAAVKVASETLNQISGHLGSEGGQRLVSVESKEHVPSEMLWHQAVGNTLQRITEGEKLNSSGAKLSKVVMARRTKLQLSDGVDALTLLASLQAKDPSAYQFCIQLPEGISFIGSTPERLFVRKGLHVASEAVAATRSRGHTSSRDLGSGIDLILSTKDHEEFEIVRQNIRQNLERVCKDVLIESHKSIIKQARVQHLYGRFLGTVHKEADEFDLLEVLHPTPAVCGHPQGPAREAITNSESFDRGLYAGPVGWFGGTGSEFAVGIRSALIESTSNQHSNGFGAIQKVLADLGVPRAHLVFCEGANIFLYAGVGVVKNSDPSSEWKELELKVSQFEALLQPSRELKDVVNINALWAELIIEECCRLGITHFCVAPGSRSSPLAAAAASNPRATCTSCIDERSLAFFALGYGRGANSPAAVITSSGTAVSNLTPAIVEASQDCVPLLVLTADRPHELRDTGANQTIDQVKHFGGHVRFFFDLPPADDKIPARMVLTTLDSAVYRAKATVPSGPVHINWACREPLAGYPEPWNTSCLQGLDRWISSSSPFTTYMNCGGLDHYTGLGGNIMEVVYELKGAERGLLVVGGLQTAQETWAVVMLASHLGWPVFPDVLSGLRIGEVFKMKDLPSNVIQHIDQMLLSKSVSDAIQPDVILQIGGRLTSRRVVAFLEATTPRAYILVEKHPFRADQSHILTHRVQASTTGFTAALLKALPKASQEHAFLHALQTLSEAVGQEINSKLSMEPVITEPYVAQAVVSSTPPGSTLFLGNSMPIRDVEMYATFQMDQTVSSPFLGLSKLTASNRGASGIDGVLSSAIGFAAGSSRRVTLLVGDVSFLHDTNGLLLLKERVGQPPVTVVVVNNEGGGIFSLLPIAKTVPFASFATLWSTEHNVNILDLCRAHRVNHRLTKTKEELEETLEWVGRSPLNWVVEVESNIERNAEFHRFLQNSITQAANRAFQVVSKFPNGKGSDSNLGIRDFEIFRYKIPLCAPPTTNVRGDSLERSWRHGFLMRITIGDGISGVGEVAPLEGLHKESLEDVEEQLQLLLPMLKGLTLPTTLPLLNGSFNAWLEGTIGIQARTLFPSVRCGLEMAILDALAASADCSLWELLDGGCAPSQGNAIIPSNGAIGTLMTTQICGLLDSLDSPNEVADAAAALVGQGFSTLKLKVGRRVTPEEDAAVVHAVRRRVGDDVQIRVDANRKWSFQQALDFSILVRGWDLQYLEEPVENPKDIPRFCLESPWLPVALDESVDEDVSSSFEALERIASEGVAAVVIKPGRVGGFERAASIASWAHCRGMISVISSAFETSVGLSAYAHLAAYVDSAQRLAAVAAHGLGTYSWLAGDVAINSSRKFEVFRENGAMVVPIVKESQGFHFNPEFVTPRGIEEVIEGVKVKLASGNKIYEFHVWDTRSVVEEPFSPTLLFLHGFLGTGRDWLPMMRALSSSFRCIAVDLPGHGLTDVFDNQHQKNTGNTVHVSMEDVSEALLKLLDKLGITSLVVPVGYSMGARIALYISMFHSDKVSAVVSISGSPGLEDEEARISRASQDSLLAQTVKEGTLESFLDSWYQQPLWESLRLHPNFEKIRKERTRHSNKDALADALESLSSGVQPSLWAKLNKLSTPALLVTGSLDTKFVNIAHQMCLRAGQEPPKKKPRRGKSLTRAQKRESWESEEYRLPFDFVEEFPEVNMLVPSLTGLPQDDGFAAFLAQEMRKLQTEDTSALEADGQPRAEWEDEETVNVFQVAEVEGCGHAVHLENPLELVQLLRAFLGRIQYAF